MIQTNTVGDLLNMAAQAERNAEALYDRLAMMFIDYPEVSRFWVNYSNEEAGHARWMMALLERLSPERASLPADETVLAHANRVLSINLDSVLTGIHNLEDAWQLANEMEHGETNLIFEFLIDHFVDDPKTLAFLRTQLRDHMYHLLIGLPAQFGNTSVRRATFPRAIDN